MINNDRKAHLDRQSKQRCKRCYRIGQTGGKRFRKDGAVRAVLKWVVSAVIRRGSWRLLQ